MKNFLLLIITCILFSCGNPGVELPPENNPVIDSNDVENESILESKILWKAPFGDSTESSGGSWPTFIENFVVFSESWAGPNGSDRMYAFNKQTGVITWTFESNLLGYRNDITKGLHASGNKLFVSNRESVYSITSNGVLRWHKEVRDYGGLTSNLIGNYFYYNSYFGSTKYPDSSSVVRYNINDGKEEKILTFYRNNDYCPIVRGSSLWLTPQGDSILIVHKRNLRLGDDDGRVDMIGYNLETDSIIWEQKDITPSGTSCITVAPQIKNDYIYLQGGTCILKINPLNGNINWKFCAKKSSDAGFFSSNLIIEDGLVIANPISEKIFALSDHSGQVVWEKGEFGEHSTENSFASPLNMVYHKGYFYFGTGWYLVCMRLEDGEVVWYEKSPFDHPNQNNLFNGTGLALDQESEILFASDQFWIMALELFNE